VRHGNLAANTGCAIWDVALPARKATVKCAVEAIQRALLADVARIIIPHPTTITTYTITALEAVLNARRTSFDRINKVGDVASKASGR